MRSGLAAVAVILCAIGVSGSVKASGQQGTFGTVSRCPSQALDRQFALSRVTSHAERLIPTTFNDFTRAERKGFIIVQAVWLAKTRTLAGATALRALAARACGARLASRSWGLAIIFPSVSLPAADQYAFAVFTRQGWRLYRPSR